LPSVLPHDVHALKTLLVTRKRSTNPSLEDMN
jgi:hypothetical protein